MDNNGFAKSIWPELSRPRYMDFDNEVPLKIWLVEDITWPHKKEKEYIPLPGFKGLAWVLEDAMCVSRGRHGGITVDFHKRGCSGWYPDGNASFERPAV
jgi:hypothetical protein